MSDLTEWREELAGVLRCSRLSWGTHSDRWGDDVWQREFWGDVAEEALTSPAMARLLAEVRAEALREAADEIPAQVSISFEVRRRIGDWLRGCATTAHPTDDHAGEAKA